MNEDNVCSFEFKKEYWQQERTEIVAHCFYRILLDLNKMEKLTLKPLKYEVTEKDGRIEFKFYFEEGCDDRPNKNY